MFHTLAYTFASAATGSNQDMAAVTDSEFSQRNSHYIFTEQYQLLSAFAMSTGALRANIFVPTWNQVTRFNIWPVNRATSNIPSNPQLDWWLWLGDGKMPPIPQNEEFQVQFSNNAGAAEQETVFLWIAPKGWNQNITQGKAPLPVLETREFFTTPTLTVNTWSGLSNITFEQSLRGGTYAVVGLQVQGTALQAARLVFPRAPVYHNRKLRPGVLGTNAIGDVPWNLAPYNQFCYGEFGRFSTFEPPQIEFFSPAVTAIAVEMRMWLVWLSDSMDVQY